MKTIFNLLNRFILLIAILVFASGVVLTFIGAYDFCYAFTHLNDDSHREVTNGFAIALLKALDLFLFAIVFFVFSFGILVLFNSKHENELPVNLPKWLKLGNFTELKIILWEAILTTLVIAYLADLAEKKFAGRELALDSLYLPGAILLISISMSVLKKGH